MARLKLQRRKPARTNAAATLPALAAKFFRAGDAAVKKELRGGDLHKFRILAKRFRYVMEYFRPCYGAAMDAYIESVKGLQDALGALNDCCSTHAMCRGLLQAGAPAIRSRKLFATLEALEQTLLDNYRSGWRRDFESPAMRKKFQRYLAHPPRVRTPEQPEAVETPAA